MAPVRAWTHRIAGTAECLLSCVVNCLLRYKLTVTLAAIACVWWVLMPSPPSSGAAIQTGGNFSNYMNLLTLAVAIVGLYLLNLRLEKQDRQMAMQTEKEVDDRFHSAIELLGNSDISTRTGALYSLYHVAVRSNWYCNQVMHVLCAYVCQRTEEDAYRERHATEPSNEIQTAINLLFRGTVEGKGLYSVFSDKLAPAYLSGAYLAGADFTAAECPKCDFTDANCQGADFAESNCQGAIFRHAQCQGASFKEALCQGADFTGANCEDADFAGS